MEAAFDLPILPDGYEYVRLGLPSGGDYYVAISFLMQKEVDETPSFCELGLVTSLSIILRKADTLKSKIQKMYPDFKVEMLHWVR